MAHHLGLVAIVVPLILILYTLISEPNQLTSSVSNDSTPSSESFNTTATNMATPLYDALVIGAGPGGLSAATSLARHLRTVIVFDSGVYRNARAEHMHNYLGFDHVPPPVLRAAGRKPLTDRYETVQFVEAEVKNLKQITVAGNNFAKDNGGHVFRAYTSKGESYFGKKVVLATGVKDVMPSDIPGYENCWARGIFHCLFCHGYEERGKESAGVLISGLVKAGKQALHPGVFAANLAKKVTFYTNGDAEGTKAMEEALAEEDREKFAVDGRKITGLEMVAEGESEVKMTFASGDSVIEGFLTNVPFTEANSPLVKDLNLETTESGDIKVSFPAPETSMPGVYAVGDCAGMLKAVPNAVNQGAIGGAMTVASLGMMKGRVAGAKYVEELGVEV